MKFRLPISLGVTLMLAAGDCRMGNHWKLIAIAPATATPLTCSSIECDASDKLSSARDRFQQILAQIPDTTTCDPKDGCYDDNPRGPFTSKDIPYVISPYDTALLNNKPSLSWYAVEGSTSYTVRVKDVTGSGLNWERTVNNPAKSASGEIKIDYPADAQPLQPGTRYKLIVEAKNESTDKRAARGEAIFTTLSQETAQQVRESVDKIDKLNVSKEEKALRHLYAIYNEKNLIADIREMLEDLVKDGSQTAEVYRRLGNMYQYQELYELAKERYEMAVKLATTTGNVQELEAAKAGLDTVNAKLKE